MRHVYVAIIPCWLAIIIDSMGFGLVYPLLTALFAGEQGLHMAEGLSLTLRHFYLGLGFLLYPLGMFFGAPLIQDFALHWGRKRVLALCMSGLFLSFFLMGLGVTLLNIPLLMIGRGLGGLMAGSQPVAQNLINDLSTPQTKARTFTFMSFIISIGIVIGPAFGGIFSDEYISPFFTLSTPFYVAACFALVTALWLLIAVNESHHFGLPKKIQWLRPLRLFSEAFEHRNIGMLVCIFILMQIGFSLFYQLIQVMLSTLFEYESWELGVFNVYLGVSFALMTLFGIRVFLKYLSEGKMAVLFLFLTGISQILVAMSNHQTPLWIFSFFVCGLDLAAYAALMITFSKKAGRQTQSWIMGIFNGIMALSWALTGLSTNLIQYLGLPTLILLGGCLLLLSAILMFFYNRNQKEFSPVTG